MGTCISNSPLETEQFGIKLANRLSPGMVVALTGDLGAGKTALTRGILKGLGFSGKVSSPTFGLINLYNTGKAEVAHLDLYRLNSPAEIIGAGISEYLENPSGISIVEWADRWQWGSQINVIHIALRAPDENRREITYEDSGA